MIRNVILLSIVAGATFAAGCADPEFAIPPLWPGAGATYTITGTPSNSLHMVGDWYLDAKGPLTPTGPATFSVATQPTQVLGPNGDIVPALVHRHTLRRDNTSYALDNHYFAASGTITQEGRIGTVVDGKQGEKVSHDWGWGLPDLFLTQFFSGRNWTPGTHETRVAPTTSNPEPPTLRWDIAISDGELMASLQPGHDEIRTRPQKYVLWFDQACPFPRQVVLQAAHFSFEASRFHCFVAKPPKTWAPVDEAILAQPSPRLQQGPPAQVWQSWNANFGTFALEEARRAVEADSTYTEFCRQKACIPMAAAWSQVLRPVTVPPIPPGILPPGNQSVQQWSFQYAAYRDGVHQASAAFRAEMVRNRLTVVKIENWKPNDAWMAQPATVTTLRVSGLEETLSFAFKQEPLRVWLDAAPSGSSDGFLMRVLTGYDPQGEGFTIGYPLDWHALDGKLRGHVGPLRIEKSYLPGSVE